MTVGRESGRFLFGGHFSVPLAIFYVTEVTDDTHHTYCGQKSGHLGVTRIVDFSLELQRKVTMWPFLVKYIY